MSFEKNNFLNKRWRESVILQSILLDVVCLLYEVIFQVNEFNESSGTMFALHKFANPDSSKSARGGGFHMEKNSFLLNVCNSPLFIEQAYQEMGMGVPCMHCFSICWQLLGECVYVFEDIMCAKHNVFMLEK